MGGLYPAPGYPAVPGYAAFPSQTEKGIRNVSQTILIFMIVQLLAVGLILALLPILAIAITQQGDPTAILGALFSLLVVACVLIVVYLVGLILGLMGLIALHKGRDEFGPQHAQKIDHGLIVLIIGILVPGVLSGAVSGGAGGAVGLPTSVSLASAAGQLVSGVLGALLVGLFLLWAIETLATPQIQQRAMIALLLGIAAGVSGGVAALIVFYTVQIPATPTFADIFPLILPSVISAVLSFVSLLVWYTTYRAVLDRFRRGELRAAPPVVMMPPAYPAPYYPYAPAPYAPPAVPPPPPEQPPPANPPPNP